MTKTRAQQTWDHFNQPRPSRSRVQAAGLLEGLRELYQTLPARHREVIREELLQVPQEGR